VEEKPEMKPKAEVKEPEARKPVQEKVVVAEKKEAPTPKEAEEVKKTVPADKPGLPGKDETKGPVQAPGGVKKEGQPAEEAGRGRGRGLKPKQTPSPGEGRGRGMKPGGKGPPPPEEPFGGFKLKAVPLKFIKKLQDIVLKEAESIGSSAVFECEVSPSTAVTSWMKDGGNLRESPKHKFTSDGKDRKLHIIDVQLSDTGEYTCVAKNAGKEITCTAKLIVEELPVKWMKELEVETSTIKGQHTYLTCELSKEKDVIWKKNNEVLKKKDGKVQITIIGLQHAVTIQNSSEDDAGTYTCEVEGQEDVKTTTNVKIIGRVIGLERPLRNATVTAGETATFECELSYEDIPVEWFLEGKKLESSDRIVFKTVGKLQSVTIRNVQMEEAGEVKLVTKDFQTEARLTVKEPPVEFSKPLQDQTVEEESTATLECEVSRENAEVRWFKDEQEIHKTKKYEIITDGRKRVLLIHECKLDDSRTYTCDAKDFKTSCFLNVEPPQVEFSKPLHDVEVKEKESARFECEVSREDAKVCWFKDGTEIRKGKKYEIIAQGRQHILIVHKAVFDDEAEYECAAKTSKSSGMLTVVEEEARFTKNLPNMEGTETDSVRLICEISKPSADVTWYKGDQELPEGGRYDQIVDGKKRILVIQNLQTSDAGEYNCRLSPTIKTSGNLKINELAAEFISRPQNQEVVEGQKAEFTCSVSKESYSVKWMKDNKELEEGEKYQMVSDGKRRSLVIKNCEPKDEGGYVVVIGATRASADLMVQEKLKVITPLKDTEGNEGQEIVLNCEVNLEGVKAKWLKNEETLFESGKYSMVQRDNVFSLRIKDAQKGDEANYIINLTNQRGEQAKSSCSLTVKEESLKILVPLEDVDTQEKKTISFSCKVNRPNATLKWMKAGQEITFNKRVVYRVDKDKHTLTIKECSLADEGEYTAVAGDSKSTAELIISEAPTDFSAQLKDQTIIEFEDAEFTCKLTKEKAEVKWYRNGREIREGPRYTFLKEGSTCTLIIKECRPDDECEYACGVDEKRSRARLFVEETPVEIVRPPQNAFEPPGSDVVFEVELNKDRVEVKWLRNNMTIVQGDKYQMMSEGKLHRLQVCEIRPRDQGEYRVIVKDKDAKAKLELAAAPQIKTTDQSYVTDAGKPIVMAIPYTAYPKAEAEWFYNNQSLPTDNIHTSADCTEYRLKDPKKSDEGRYKVLIKNKHGGGEAFINLDVIDVPGPVKNLQVVDTADGEVSLAWEEPESDGGSKVIAYVVERRDVKRKTWTLATDHAESPEYTVTGLQKDSFYLFRVSARNRVGSGPIIETDKAVQAKNKFDVPDAPLNVIVGNVTKFGCTVSWEPPVSDGGSPITSYIIELRDRTSVKWSPVQLTKADELSAIINDVIENKEYIFRVKAENKAGVGRPSAASQPVKIMDPIEPPSPPQNLSWSDQNKSSVQLTWETPMKNGGSMITGYIIERCEDGTDKWLRCNARLCPDLFYKPLTIRVPISGYPTPVAKWTFGEKELTAENERVSLMTKSTFTELVVTPSVRPDKGIYTLHLENDVTTVSGEIEVNVIAAPSAPKDFKVLEVTRQHVHLSWEAPEHDGGSPLTGYQVEKRDVSRKTWVKVITGIQDLEYTVTDVVEGKEYLFRVTACNKCGPGEPAYIDEPVNVSSPATVSDPPENLKWRDKSASGIFLTWEPPKYDGGSSIRGYNVERCQRGTDKWEPCGDMVPELKCQVTGLIEGQWYAYRVRALNRLGASQPCKATDEIQAVDPKEAPEIQLDAKLLAGLTANAGSKIELPAEVKGKPEPRVKWTKADLVLKPDDRVTIDTKPGHSTVTIAKTTRDDTSTYIIEATNSSGRATATVDVNILDTPGAPYKLEGSDIAKDSLTLTWYEPDEDGGSPITGYWVERYEADHDKWIRCNKLPIKDTNYRVKGLPTRKKYKFRVLAENLAGTGKPSKETDPILIKDPIDPPWAPGKPTVKDVAKTSCFLMWTKPEHDGGAKIDSYVIEMLKSGTTDWIRVAENISGLEYFLKGLMEKQEYSFRVRAVNIAGESEPSEPSEPVLCKERLNPPSAPRWLEVISISRNSAELKWTAPERDGGSRITNYVVEKRDVRRKGWQAVDTTVKELKYTVTPLNEGSLYVFRVAAENAVGVGPFCELEDSVLAKDTFTTPGPPYALTVNAVTKKYVDLQWEEPKNDGGRPILRYSIEKKEKLGTRWVKCGKTSGPDCKYRVTDVIEGTEVQFQVRAENEAGVGHPSEPTEILTIEDPTGVPSPPIELHVTGASRNFLSIAWKPPQQDGGSPIRGYHIEMCEAGTQKWMRVNSRPVKELKYQAEEGVVPEKEYIFRVRAINAVGESEPSDISENVFAKDSDCNPTLEFQTLDLVVVETEKLHIPVPFKAVPAPRVTWHKDGKELKADERIGFRKEYTSLHLEIDSSVHPDAGVYKVTLENKLGSASATINVKVIGLPGPCKEIVASEITKSSCKVSWDPPDYDGGSPILHYVLQRREAGRRTYVNMMSGENKVSWTVKDLIPNGEYYFRVQAVNKIGGGEFIELRNPVIAEDQKHPPKVFLSGSLQSGLSVRRGCEICLDANISGSPYPQITWYWNNQEIQPEQLRKRPEKPLKKKAEEKKDEEKKEEEKKDEEKKEEKKEEGEAEKKEEKKEEEVKEGEEKKEKEKPEEAAAAEPEMEEDDYPTINERLAIDNSHRGVSSVVIRDSIRRDHGVFMVKVENNHGIASATCEVNVLDTPGPPVNLRFEEVRKNSVICKWDPPLDDGGSEILNYTVEKKDNSKLDFGWSSVTATLRGCRYLVPKLIEKKEYIFRVVAENKFGPGPPCVSKPVVAKNPFEPPEAPDKPVIDDITANSMLVTWNEPDGNGSPILGYWVERREINSSHWARVNREIVPNTELNVEGLLEGLTYIFRVAAENQAGPGKFSVPSEPKTAQAPILPPGPPVARVVETTDHSIDVEWDPPADTGGGDILGYHVDKAMAGTKDWSRSTERPWKTRAFTVYGVREGAKYIVRVIACNAAGEGTPGFTESVFVRNPAEVPVIELDLSVKNGVTIRAGETLRIPATVTGKPYPSISWTKDDNKPDKDRVEILSEGNTSIVSIKNVQRKDCGKYQISVCNPSGIKSAWTRVDVMDVPGPITDLKPVVVTRKMIFLNWDDPEDDGGSDITGFIVERRDAKMHTWRQPVETASSKCECVGIMEGQEYFFRVFAKNKFGVGPPVELGPIKAVDPQGPPSYPEKFHYTERTKNSITFAWKPPRNDGGSPVIGYFVEKKRQDQQAFEPCNTEMCPNLSMTIEGLEEAWMYEFRIKCANLIGQSEPSIPLTVVIQDDEVSPEVHLLKHFKADTIIVRKNEPVEIPANVIGLPIPKIEWSKDDVVIEQSTETLLIDTEVTGRMNAKTTLSIPAVNRRDRGSYTVTASNNMGSAKHTVFVMVLDRPTPPRNLTVTNIMAESCYLNWDAPLD
ncbi:Titin, partial [Oryzias melastigma]